MLAGTFGLCEFTDLRVKKREESSRLLTTEEAKKFRKSEQSESLEDLYKVRTWCVGTKNVLPIGISYMAYSHQYNEEMFL